jgi:hypothetical protein
MALRWLDGFETYGTTPGNSTVGIIPKWNTGSSTDSNFTVKAGRIASTFGVQFATNAVLITPTFTGQDTWVVGFAYKQDGYTNEQEIFQFREGTNVQVSVAVTAFGELKIYRGASFSPLGTTSGAILKCGVWSYIEIKVKIHSSTGTVDVRVNGTSVLSLTGKNTNNSGTAVVTNVKIEGNLNSTDKGYFDDFYLLDNTGSNNTTFLGPQKIVAVFPNADGGTLQWTPNSGSNHYDRVNENPADTNTTYLSDSTSGHVDIFTKAATPASITSIKGVQQNTYFETDSGSAFSLIQRLVSGGTTSDAGGTAGVNGTYGTAARLLETDPNTGSLWTQSNLDSATIGIKVA